MFTNTIHLLWHLFNAVSSPVPHQFRSRSSVAFIPAIGFALFVGLLFVTQTMAPPARGQMAVVFAPLTDELTAWALVRQAGGLVVGPTRLPNVVVAFAPDDAFAARITGLGALFTLSARGLCAPVLTEKA